MNKDESTGRRVLDVHVDISDTLELDLVMVQNLGVQGHTGLGSTIHGVLVPQGLRDPSVRTRRAVAPQDTECRRTRGVSVPEADKVYEGRRICDRKASTDELLSPHRGVRERGGHAGHSTLARAVLDVLFGGQGA